MTVLAIALLYAAVGMYTARVFTVRAIRAWERDFDRVTEGDKTFHAAYGIFVGAGWPIYWLGRLFTGSLVASVPPSEKELRAQQTAQARRIAELERQLGIKDRP